MTHLWRKEILIAVLLVGLVYGAWRASNRDEARAAQETAEINPILQQEQSGLILGEETLTLDYGRSVTCIIAYDKINGPSPRNEVSGIDCLEPIAP